MSTAAIIDPTTGLRSVAPDMWGAMARAIAPRKPITVSQWADAHRVLSRKGSAMPGRWITDRNPALREPMDCMSARSSVRDEVLKFPIQFGKALGLDTPLPTPAGWVTMGQIQPGNEVFGADGRPARVVAASDVFLEHPCFRVHFQDGQQVLADAGHRWQVVDCKRVGEARKEIARRAAHHGLVNKRGVVSGDPANHKTVMTTSELAAAMDGRKQSRFAVFATQPLRLPHAELPLDPYLLGLWLGDGHTHQGAITTPEPEVVLAFAAFDPKPQACQNAGKATTYGLRGGFGGLLRRTGLLGAKHIPTAYLRASFDQRLALLQGLLDTDGFAAPNGNVEFTSSNPRLADGVLELMHTLGFRPTIRWRKTKRKDSARITFTATRDSCVFRLPRKLQCLPLALSGRGAHLPHLRFITKIEPVASVPTRCIAVDSPDHLYLCGHGFIPTHNTEVAANVLGYTMTEDPGPIMVCLPTEVSMNKWVAQKLNPMIEETDVVRAALTSIASRDAANTRTFKDFAGGQLYLEHAGSPSRLKSTSVKVLLVDEVDEFAANLTGGDDPMDMLLGRTSAFPVTSRRLFISTPGIRGISRIDELFEASDQRHYHVPCPHCAHMQPLQWAGLKWSDGGQQAWYVCRECGGEIKEHHKTAMLAAGRWVAEKPGVARRGYTINCLYYAFGLGPRWAELAQLWLAAQNDPAKLKTFINDRLAESWEDPAMRAVRHNAIADRAESYQLRHAPEGVLAVTAGVDSQDDRLAVQIVGWGMGMAFWVLDYVELPGDPAGDAVWVALTDLLNRPIQHASGALLRVLATAHDYGGHRGEAVKYYSRQRLVRRHMPITGAVANTAPVLGKGKLADVNWRGRADRRGVTVWQVGTVAAKHWLYGRLSTDADKEPQQRLTHFSDELDRAYFAGLVSESFNPAKNRFEKRRGARNEPLDTWVYAFAAAHHPELRLNRHTRADWQQMADQLAAQAANPVSPTTPTLPAPPVSREQSESQEQDLYSPIHLN